jgi:hypothetical protein
MKDLLAFLAHYSDGSRPQAQHQVILDERWTVPCSILQQCDVSGSISDYPKIFTFYE